MVKQILAVAAALPVLAAAQEQVADAEVLGGPAITTTEGGIARKEKGPGGRLAEAYREAKEHENQAKEFATSPGHDLANAYRYAESHPRQVKTARDYIENHGLSAHDLANIKRYGEAHLLNPQEMAEITKHNNKGSVLGPHDIVGTTFFIACNMMLAFTAFFFVQVGVVPTKWRTSFSIAGLVTGVAFYNYTFMKEEEGGERQHHVARDEKGRADDVVRAENRPLVRVSGDLSHFLRVQEVSFTVAL